MMGSYWQKKAEEIWKILYHYYLVHFKSHMDWSGIEVGRLGDRPITNRLDDVLVSQVSSKQWHMTEIFMIFFRPLWKIQFWHLEVC
jgi:hypothetical protein